MKSPIKVLILIKVIIILSVMAVGTTVVLTVFNKTTNSEKTTISALKEEVSQYKERIDFLLSEENEDPAKVNTAQLKRYIKVRYTGVPMEVADLIAERINVLSQKHNMSFSLIAGVVEVESQFNPFVSSKVGAKGLMQVRPEIWGTELKIERPNDLHGIEAGIEAGIKVLKHYIVKNKGSITKALRNYNGASDDVYAEKVYSSIGRFVSFKTNTFNSEETQQ